MQRDRLGQWNNGDNVRPSTVSGLERLKNPGLNKVKTRFYYFFYSSPISVIARPVVDALYQTMVRFAFFQESTLTFKLIIVYVFRFKYK